jgi:hypothetical protein
MIDVLNMTLLGRLSAIACVIFGLDQLDLLAALALFRRSVAGSDPQAQHVA